MLTIAPAREYLDASELGGERMGESGKPERLLRLPEVMDRTGCKRAKLYQMVARGEFPKPVKIDACARWPESAIDRWIAERIAASAA